MTTPVILWLEDEPGSQDTIISVLRQCGVGTFFCGTPEGLIARSRAIAVGGEAAEVFGFPPDAELKGFIVDVMLKGVPQVICLDGSVSDTEDGYEAGWKVLSGILRAKGSGLAHIPVLVLSAREDDATNARCVSEIAALGGGSIAMVRKFMDQTEEVKDWLMGVKS